MDPTKIMRIFTLPKLTLGGGFKYFRKFHLYIWEMIQFDWYLWYGVKPPTRNLTWQWKKGKHIWRWHLLLQHADVPASHSFLFVGCIPVKISADGPVPSKKNILTGYPGEGESRQQWHGCVPCKHVPFGTPVKKNNGTLCWSLGKKRARFTTQ